MKKEEFLTYYSRLSNIELLKILEEKEKYQPGAIDAANEILSERNYSNDELNAVKAEINLSVNKKIERREKINKRINKVNKFIDEYFGIKERSPEKILNIFCAALFLYTFFHSIFNVRDLAGYYYSTFTSWSIAILIYLIQLFISYLLYIRSNWGWILIVACCVILAIQNIITFIESFRPRNGFLDFLYEPINPYSLALSFFINTCVILFLNRKNIYQQFTITKNGRMATLLIPAGILAVFLIIQYILRNSIVI